MIKSLILLFLVCLMATAEAGIFRRKRSPQPYSPPNDAKSREDSGQTEFSFMKGLWHGHGTVVDYVRGGPEKNICRVMELQIEPNAYSFKLGPLRMECENSREKYTSEMEPIYLSVRGNRLYYGRLRVGSISPDELNIYFHFLRTMVMADIHFDQHQIRADLSFRGRAGSSDINAEFAR